MKYKEDSIHFLDSILISLNKQFIKKAEEIALENKREIVLKEDMCKAVLLLLTDKGAKLISHFTEEKPSEYCCAKCGLLGTKKQILEHKCKNKKRGINYES